MTLAKLCGYHQVKADLPYGLHLCLRSKGTLRAQPPLQAPPGTSVGASCPLAQLELQTLDLEL